MNPDRIYSQYRDDALAKQATATEYTTFVAMPFKDQFSYRSRQVYVDVIQAAATSANTLNKTPRHFAKPKRADDGAGTAIVITEQIVSDMLHAHVFLGDLTFQNAGVLLEVGIAMGLKPNPQIILITQGDVRDLHFDIRNNNVMSYNPADAVPKLADAMVASALSFETEVDRYIDSIEKTLTPEAIVTLNFYGRLWRDNPGLEPSLHDGIAGEVFPHARAQERLEASTRELLARRLIFTDYKAGAIQGGDLYGMHATELGWAVIAHIWPELKRANGKSTP